MIKREEGEAMRKKALRNSIPYLGMLAGIAILDLCAYGGILHSGWVPLCLSGALSVICLLRGKEAEYPARTARKANIAIWIFCAAVFLLDVILAGNRYHLMRYYFYGAVFCYMILFILEKKDILPEKRLRFLYWLAWGELEWELQPFFVWRRGFPPGSRRKRCWKETVLSAWNGYRLAKQRQFLLYFSGRRMRWSRI